MTQLPKTWPPLIVGDDVPAWTRWRDFVLTSTAWVVFAMMLRGSFELFLGSYLERLGLGPLLEHLGFDVFGIDANWLQFFGRLEPYLAIVFILVSFLGGFALHTLRRRGQALKAPRPKGLPLATEARRAGLAGMIGQADMGETAVLDDRKLLVMSNDQNEAALVDARDLSIATVHITAGGSFRIDDAAPPSQATTGHQDTEAKRR